MNERIKLIAVAIAFTILGAVLTLTITQGINNHYPEGDLNRDGVVDGLDLSVVLNHWTK